MFRGSRQSIQGSMTTTNENRTRKQLADNHHQNKHNVDIKKKSEHTKRKRTSKTPIPNHNKQIQPHHSHQSQDESMEFDVDINQQQKRVKSKYSEDTQYDGSFNTAQIKYIHEFHHIIKQSTHSTHRHHLSSKDSEMIQNQRYNTIRFNIHKITEQMNQAWEKDIQAIKHNRPAQHKLCLLPSIVQLLSKHEYEQSIFNSNLLDAIRRWIQPDSKSNLPSLTIRTQLLTSLTRFTQNIPLSVLQHTRLGRLVMFMIKHPNETDHNKKLCQELIIRWSQPISQLCRDDQISNHDQQCIIQRQEILRKTLYEQQKTISPTGIKHTQSVPECASMDYITRPENDFFAKRTSKQILMERLHIINPYIRSLSRKTRFEAIFKKIKGRNKPSTPLKRVISEK